MRKRFYFRMRNSSLLTSAVVAACSWSGLAGAGSWEITDDVALTTTYVDRTGDDEASGLVLELSPRLTARGRGGRITADINYAPNLAVGDSGVDPETLTHDLLATGQVELVRDRFFLGAEANAGLSGSSATSGRVDAINFSDEGQQYFSLRLRPEARHRINRYANIVSRNSVDIVSYRGDDSGSQSDSSSAYNLNLGVQSGRAFTALNWAIDADYSETDYDDRTDRDRSVNATTGYTISRQWQINGGVGYEDNDVSTSRDDTSGATWDVGASWAPTPRTSASVNYGSRYFGDSWSGGFSHRTRKTRIALDYSREVTNRRQQRLVDSLFFLVDDNGNIVTDPNTGAPIIANIPQLQDIDEDFLDSRLRGILTVTGRRTDVTFTATVSDRDYEISGDSEDSFGVSVGVTRQLGSGYNASLSSSYTEARDTADGDSDNLDVRFRLSKQFSTRTSASLDLLYRDENDDNDDDITEKRIGLTLRANLL